MSYLNECGSIKWRISDSELRRVCMLMVTHECNLNCKYCYEHYKSNRKMSFELAQQIILKEIKLVSNHDLYTELEIDFMGGEPLMNFELIRQVVEWIEESRFDIPIICFASTNGTLLDENRKNWFRKHSNNIWLSLSYDGDEEMQNKNRGSNGYDIDLDFFLQTWPEQGVQMTISKATLPHMANGILKLQSKGVVVTASLAQGESWSRSDALIYARELKKLSNAYIENKSLEPCSRLMRMVWCISSLEDVSQVKYCGSGVHMCTYDVDGREFGCHLFTSVVLGDKALSLSEHNLNAKDAYVDSRCEKCILRNFCGTCAGFNYIYRGNPALRDMSCCLMSLAEAKVSCDFQAELIANRLVRLNSIDAKYAKEILKAKPMLQQFDTEIAEGPFII